MNDLDSPEQESVVTIAPSRERTRIIVAEVAVGVVAQAVLRVWGHFTAEGFVVALVSGLVIGGLSLLFILPLAQGLEDRERRRGAQ